MSQPASDRTNDPLEVRDADASPPAPVTAPSGTRSARRPFVVLGLVVVASLLVLGAYAWWTSGLVTTEDAHVEADVVTLAPRVGGAIAKVHVVDDERVQRGDVLVELDDSDLEARLAQAQAELAVAQAQADAAEAEELVVAASAKGGLASARAQVSTSAVAVQGAAAQIAAARAAVGRAEAEARKAQLDLDRAKRLHAEDAIPRERLEAAQLAHDAAQAALAQARAGLEAAADARRAAASRVDDAEGKLAASSPIDARIAAASAAADLARARVQAAKAAVRLAELQVGYARIVAPEDGAVAKLNAHVGQLVAANQPIAMLVPVRTYVVANFKETDIGGMRPGQKARIQIDAFPEHELTGVVESLAAGTGARFSLLQPDNATGNFVKVVQRVPVRIRWERLPDLPLRAGLSAEVTVELGEGR